MGRKKRDRVLQFVDDLVANTVHVLTRSLGVESEKARAAGEELAHMLCAQYARANLYIPTDLDFRLTDRDRDLWQAYQTYGPDNVRPFTRDRVDQLAELYEITPQQVYNIIRMMKKAEMAERQWTLPGLE